MHLKSLELTGFKSFAEAKIEFPKGITAVVGPNGTGKSNVVDSILWVLGEQSAKTLRSERMEDVIFNGTQSRKPLGMAEVSLIMSGVEQERLNGFPTLPHQLGEYHEVMITRRLYRNGDSEYLINKTPCRLKDIRSLFLDSRAGTKGHTVIEQGRIEQILNASPQDRRELIEETAGIVRYKKQKAEALRKLDATQQNLVRVRDIIAEVKRQLNSLERQARQARSYQTFQQEARALEVRLLVQECRALLKSRAAVEAELAELEACESAGMAEQGRLEQDFEQVRLRLLAREESLSRVREEAARLEHEQAQALAAVEVEKGRLVLYEQQRKQTQEELMRLAAERDLASTMASDLRSKLASDEAALEGAVRACSELEASAQALSVRREESVEEEEQARREIITVTVQVTNGENALVSLKSRDEALLRQLDRLATELTDVEAQYAQVARRLQQTIARREESDRTVQALRDEATAVAQQTQRLEERLRETDQTIGRQQAELAAVESRLRALQGILREEMGYGREGEEETTSLRAACEGVRDSVAEWLVVPPGLERAVEALLGERVRAWLVESPAQARRAIEFLNQKGLGRGAFVPLSPRCSLDAADRLSDSWWPHLQGQPGVRGRAIDLLQARNASREALASLFADAVIVNSLEVAIAQWERGIWSAPCGPVLVTIDGEVMDAAGVVTGGTAGTAGGLLLRRREIQRLEDQRAELDRALEQNRRNREQLLAQHDSGKAALHQLNKAIREIDLRIVGLERDEVALTQQSETLARRIETIHEERRVDENERAKIQGEMESFRVQVAQLMQEKTARETHFAELQARLKEIEAEHLMLQQRLTESRLALASIRARLDHGRADLARVVKEQEEREQRVIVLNQQLEALAAAAQQSQAQQERNEALFHELERRSTQIRSELISAQEGHSQDLEMARELEKGLAAVRESLTSTREARTGVEVRRAEIAAQLSIRESTLIGTYQLSLEAAFAQDSAQIAVPGSEGESPDPTDPEADPTPVLRQQLQKLRDRLERLGPINLAAIEEHRELEERYRFLTTQEEDLSRSVNSLKEIIHRINKTTKDMFLETFNELQQKFGEVFSRFFPGGRAELVLTEPQQDREGETGSDEPGIDIVAQPPGKRLKSISMLSGGEKTLTAMALIFASFLIRPTPFCILDEIDAPLDEENIGRFTGVLRELSDRAQFIVITHNKRTMAIADSLFGVTMEEPGVSKLVSVRLADLQPA